MTEVSTPRTWLVVTGLLQKTCPKPFDPSMPSTFGCSAGYLDPAAPVERRGVSVFTICEPSCCHDCGFSTGFPRPHRAQRTWSKPGCCQSGCLTISHNCGLLCIFACEPQDPAGLPFQSTVSCGLIAEAVPVTSSGRLLASHVARWRPIPVSE